MRWLSSSSTGASFSNMRSAASRAMPAPVMPPPTTRSSIWRSPSVRRAEARVAGESGAATRGLGSVGGAELGEHRLSLGDLVRAAELSRELQCAPRVLDAFVPPAAVLADAGERDAGGYGGRIERDDSMETRLAAIDVAAEEAR